MFPRAKNLLDGLIKDDANRKSEPCAQPYDNRWELPEDRLKLGVKYNLLQSLYCYIFAGRGKVTVLFDYRIILGKQIGVGCFGRVFKSEATIGVGGKESGETATRTVAVKMVKSRNPAAYRKLESLIVELKILIYLGPHFNVVGLLGACTNNIIKGIRN